MHRLVTKFHWELRANQLTGFYMITASVMKGSTRVLLSDDLDVILYFMKQIVTRSASTAFTYMSERFLTSRR